MRKVTAVHLTAATHRLNFVCLTDATARELYTLSVGILLIWTNTFVLNVLKTGTRLTRPHVIKNQTRNLIVHKKRHQVEEGHLWSKQTRMGGRRKEGATGDGNDQSHNPR